MADGTRLVKQYAGVRLYDTVALAYVTVEQLRQLHRVKGTALVVQDAVTGEDVTQRLLTSGDRSPAT